MRYPGGLTWQSVKEIIFSQSTEGWWPPILTEGLLQVVVLCCQDLQGLRQSFVLLHFLLQLQTPNLVVWSWYTLHVLNIHAHGIENNDGKLKLIDMEERICSDPCHGVCLRFRWQLIVMNLYTDLVSFGPEPKTTVTEAQDWMSLQSNLRCATRLVFPTVKLLLLGDVQPYFMQLKLLQQHVELQHRLMTILYICLQMPTETCWGEKKIWELIQKKLFFNSYQSHLNKKPRHCQPHF